MEKDSFPWELGRHPAMLQSYFSRYLLDFSCVLVIAISSIASSAAPLHEDLEPFLEENCFDCHDDETSKGGLNLLSLEFAPDRAENFKLWERVFDRIGSDEMPPKNKPRPDAAAKRAVLEMLEAPLFAAARNDKATRGRVNARRLTRREYEYTLHDLLGVDLPLQELLPEDPATHGFETVASGQQLSHFNIASYLEAADLALDEAFGRAIRGDREFKRAIGHAKLGKAGAGRGNFRGRDARRAIDRLADAPAILRPHAGDARAGIGLVSGDAQGRAGGQCRDRLGMGDPAFGHLCL